MSDTFSDNFYLGYVCARICSSSSTSLITRRQTCRQIDKGQTALLLFFFLHAGIETQTNGKGWNGKGEKRSRAKLCVGKKGGSRFVYFLSSHQSTLKSRGLKVALWCLLDNFQLKSFQCFHHISFRLHILFLFYSPTVSTCRNQTFFARRLAVCLPLSIRSYPVSVEGIT